MSHHPPARTIYIASWGRSGSTALASCLGAPPGAVAVGELNYLWDRGLLGQTLCACLEPVVECPFWQPVIEDVADRVGGGSVEALAAMGAQGPKLRHLRRLLRRPHRLEVEHGPWLEVRRALHAALVGRGHHTIVDSSKRPVDLLALSRLPEVAAGLEVIHLVRHPARTARSWSAAKPDRTRTEGALNQMGRVRALAWWWWWNRSIGAVTRTIDQPVRPVIWEELTTDPDRVLGGLLGPAAAEVMSSPGVVSVEASHQIGGNPVRLDDASGRLEIRPDRGPVDLPWFHRAWLGPEMRRLGYRNGAWC